MLLKPVFFLAKRIEASYENSYIQKIINIVLLFFRRLNTTYENSLTAYVARSLTGLLYNSAIIGFFIRKGNLTKWWEHSLAFRILNAVINLPSKTLKGVYRKFEAVLSESLIIKLLQALLSRMEVIVGCFLLVILLVPDKHWNNAYNLLIALFLVFLIFINTVVQRNWEFNFKALDFTLILFMITVVLSHLTSLYPSLSSKFLLFYLASFLLVLAIASAVKSEKSLGTFVDILLIGVTLTGLFGLWQVVTGAVPFDPSLTDIELNEGMPGRIFSTMRNPNNYAEVLIMLIPFYIAVVMNSKSIVKKAVYLAFALPPLVALFYTGSRSGWIGFAISILVFTFFTNKRLIPLLLVAGVLFVPFLPQHVYRRILTIFKALNDTSAQYRVQIIKTIYPMFKDYIVTGIGLGTDVFRKIADNYYIFTEHKKTPVHTHILYWQIWIEVGLVGFISFMWFIYRTLKNSIINIYSSSKGLKNILAACVASLLGILAMGFVEYIWFYPRVMIVFFIVIGITAAASGIADIKNRRLSEY